MNRPASVARAAFAAVSLAVAVAACGGGVTTPARSAPAAPTAMPAGTYRSTAFQPPVSFTVPEGWVQGADSRLYLSLRPVGDDLIGLHLFRDPQAASQDPACPAAPEPGVGGSSRELAAWIADRPGLAVGAPTMASVGGLRGVALEIRLRPEWTASCPFAGGAPSVPLFNSPEIDHWVVVGNERLRVYLLDLPGGGTVAVDLDAFDGNRFDDLVARAGDIVRSLEFEVADGASSSPAGTSASPGGRASP